MLLSVWYLISTLYWVIFMTLDSFLYSFATHCSDFVEMD